MVFYHNISPVFLHAGPLSIRWYGLFYALGLLSAYLLSERRLRRQGLLSAGGEGRVFNAIILGVIAGARLGYCLFYNFSYYSRHPFEILFIWEGGLSFHGGLLGGIAALWYLGGRTLEGLHGWGDAFALYAPIGLGLGRIGNFMNSELVGRPTNGDWGVVFQRVDAVVRHPSQLYEAALEGGLLFLTLWLISKQCRKKGIIFWSSIILYGVFRTFVEQFREPDAHIGTIAAGLSAGQILSLPMIIFAAGMIIFIVKNEKASAYS